jgi:hypothetical protein
LYENVSKQINFLIAIKKFICKIKYNFTELVWTNLQKVTKALVKIKNNVKIKWKIKNNGNNNQYLCILEKFLISFFLLNLNGLKISRIIYDKLSNLYGYS